VQDHEEEDEEDPDGAGKERLSKEGGTERRLDVGHADLGDRERQRAELQDRDEAGGLLERKPAGTAAAESLDVSRLQDTVLTPLLGIGDVRSDKRIDFVGGARGTSVLEQLVSSGKAAVAFSMYPVSMDDLFHISDAGGIMPPKSTWFEPKLRDGLLSHVI